MRILTGNWIEVKDGDARVRGMYQRHYSAHKYKGDLRIVGPGEHMILMTQDCLALFAWRKGHDSGYRWHGIDAQIGVNCTIFRNEGDMLSSDLIKEADEMAWRRWPTEPRHYTYVNADKIKSSHPGYCFLMAGWDYQRDESEKPVKTKGGLYILEQSLSSGLK